MRIIVYIKYCLLLAIVFLTASCGKDLLPDGESGKRTVLIYIATNNSLFDETKPKIDGALAGWEQSYGKMLFLVETPGKAPILQEATVANGVKTVTTIKEYTNGNAASCETFEEVLEDVKIISPNDCYGLVFFSHSSGWAPEHTLNNPYIDTRSVGVSGTKEMELRDFAAAIPDGMFDYIIFESCLMAGVEVAYELKDKTDYIVAASAEIVMPGFTKTYPDNIARLYGDKSKLTTIAKQFFIYVTTSDPFRSGTVSVIRTDHLDQLAAIVKDINANQKSFDIEQIQHFDRQTKGFHLFFDLGDFMAKQATPAQMQTFQNAIDNCVIYKAASNDFLINYQGFNIQSHSGLTTYIEQDQFPFMNQQYKLLKWSKAIAN